jgi:signal transduction histidine kinase
MSREKSLSTTQTARDERRAWEPSCRRGRSRSLRSLQRQKEALSELNRRKDEFLAMLSHELRNPLASIRNAAHVLSLLQSEDDLRERAKALIERQVAQMTRLVDDLTEVSRIATGKLRLCHDWVVMSGIVERAVDTVRPLMSQRQHTLEVSLPPQPISLCADAARLEQVIVNLLVNAAKYTDESGHVRLTVTQEGDECVLRLRDTGVGIAPELLPHVFDLFMQEKRSRERSGGGLGVGLALVKRLVEMHQGRVEVDSTLGQGTEFVVRLPVALPPTPQFPLVLAETPALSLQELVFDRNRRTGESLTMPARA